MLGLTSNISRVLGPLLVSDLSTPVNCAHTVKRISIMSVSGKMLGVLLAGAAATAYGGRVAMVLQVGGEWDFFI